MVVANAVMNEHKDISPSTPAFVPNQRAQRNAKLKCWQ